MARRHFSVAELSRHSSVATDVIQKVLDGSEPSSSFLRQLASSFDLHAADVFAIAQRDVPADLAAGPSDDIKMADVPELVGCALHLSAEHRRQLREYVQALPQLEQTQPSNQRQTTSQTRPTGAGAIIAGLLLNRNLNQLGTAKVLFYMTGGVARSASTVAMIEHGRIPVTSELLTAFATILNVRPEYIAALDTADPTIELVPDPAMAGVAELIWDVRRLTSEQMEQTIRVAKSM